MAAIETDANGYICLVCGAKVYTDRKVFIGPQCPKCPSQSLVGVVGYYCEKDKYLTVRPRNGDKEPVVCDKCKTPLSGNMRMPHETDLKAWGATKVLQ